MQSREENFVRKLLIKLLIRAAVALLPRLLSAHCSKSSFFVQKIHLDGKLTILVHLWVKKQQKTKVSSKSTFLGTKIELF